MGSQVNGTNGATPTVAPAAFTEAPASINTLVVSPSGFTYQLTMRSATVAAVLTQAATLEQWLAAHEWKPAPTRQASQGHAANSVQSNEPAPLCDKCGQLMKRRQTKDGSRQFWSCTTKYGNGQWCQGKPVSQS